MKVKIVLLSMLFLVLTVGIVGAQTQVLLDATTIPKFTDPLPVAGDIRVINAQSIARGGLSGDIFEVRAEEFKAQILPETVFPASWVWGYLTSQDNTATPRPSYLGPVIIAEKGIPAFPEYINALPVNGHVQSNLPIDMTLDWARIDSVDCLPTLNALTGLWEYQNTKCGLLPGEGGWDGPIPIATHLHGGEVAPAFDGGPDAWFYPGNTLTGIGWPGSVYTYPNEQQESTIWFHDHALGITRLNVYAGLAGLYPIVDPANPPLAIMPKFPEYDIPLIIQDRSFDVNGQIFYNLASNPQPNPTVHPFWIPEFIGDTIVVNGKTWPYLNVEPRQYRFRFVNGSNARFYELTFNDVRQKPSGRQKVLKNMVLPQLVIATDDGYLLSATPTNMLVLGPGERYEVIVDFTGLPLGSEIVMKNSARTPYPGGGAVVTGLTDTVMKFNVVNPLDTSVAANTNIAAGDLIRPTPLEPIQAGHDPLAGSITRQLTLNEVIGPGGPLELVVNNSKLNKAGLITGSTTPLGRETELPALGDTEIWEIINITADAHPMHTHLVGFQIIDRTPFEANAWIVGYDAALLGMGVLPGEGPPYDYNVMNADNAIGGNPPINVFLKLDQRRGPLPYEMGWKDTVITYPGEVTRIAVRWATTDTPVAQWTAPDMSDGDNENNTYPFDPTVLTGGVGYVWHCHIIDHEDNEMMRNYVVGDFRQTGQ